MLKKRQSRRISSRKKHNIEKKIKNRAKKLSKLKKKEMRGRVKLPKTVLLMDEELEHLKRIREEEKKRAMEGEVVVFEMDFSFKKLVEESDLLLEVLDARDPLGSRSPSHEKYVVESGKELVLVINNRDNIPVGHWEEYLRGMGYTVGGYETTKRIGIFGQKGVGKMHLLRHLDTPLVSRTLVRTPPQVYDLLALLRNVISLKEVYSKKFLEAFLESTNRDDFIMYFGVPYFDTLKDLEESFMKKFRLTPSGIQMKIFSIILEEVHKGNIKFYRDIEGKIIYEYK